MQTLHARLDAAVAKLMDAPPEAAESSIRLVDALRDLAEAADSGVIPVERCQEEADLVVQRIDALLAARS